jgi:hypothetical protein
VAVRARCISTLRLDSVACVVHPIVRRRRKRQGSHECARERQRSRTLRLWLGLARPARSCRTVESPWPPWRAAPQRAHPVTSLRTRTRYSEPHSVLGSHASMPFAMPWPVGPTARARYGRARPCLLSTPRAPLRSAVQLPPPAEALTSAACLPVLSACPVRLSPLRVYPRCLLSMPGVDAVS